MPADRDPGPGRLRGRAHVARRPSSSRKAFEDLDSALPFEQRVRCAYEIGLNNIAEGILNIAIKHGVDPRDFTLVAYGAAGPMLLPALLDLVHVDQVIVPPHPGLFSALGLLSAPTRSTRAAAAPTRC